MSLVIRNGWHVPEHDNITLETVLREVNDLNKILPHCKRRTAIQAGGNVGVWAVEMAKHFDMVVTVEPDPVTYSALALNVRCDKNITAYNVGLGDTQTRGAMDRWDYHNIGSYQVKPGDDFDIITIDSLGIHDVDLIQLDIEGYEHQAILGAIETIKNCNPVICLELKGLGDRYGFSDGDTISVLEDLGYKIADRFHRDVLFTKR